MVIVGNGTSHAIADGTLRTMFEERKRVFVDLLKWDIPVLADRYEVDQFDTPHAVYILVTDDMRRHCGSARLLPTNRPHILDTIFPELCDEVTVGSTIMEITRFCLSRHLSACERRLTRNRLVSAFAEYALLHGITTYIGVAEMRWFQQILAFGWECLPLSPPKRSGSTTLVSFKINITTQTIDQLRASGIYTPVKLNHLPIQDAA